VLGSIDSFVGGGEGRHGGVYSLTSALFCVPGSSFSTPLLSHPRFLPASLEAMAAVCLTSTGAAKNSFEISNIFAMSCGGMPVATLFSTNTKPYLEAADKSCWGASGLEGEMSIIGMEAFEDAILDGLSNWTLCGSGVLF
jgi:hypothetical protein